MNKVLTKYIFLATALLISSAAMAQRTEDPGQGQAQQEHRVIVGGDIFGGGNKAPVKGSCSVMIRQRGNRVGGDVYGGGALADVNVTATVSGGTTTYSHTPNTTTQVDILEGTIVGDVYGGGLGNADTAALVYGKVTVNIGAGTVDQNTGFATTVSGNASFRGTDSNNNHFGGNVFGCNNINGTPLDSVFVNIFKTAHNDLDTVTNFTDARQYAIDSVFGGGNKADYLPATVDRITTVHVYTCNNTIQKVYGGGNAADLGNATIGASDTIIIDGGRFDWVFGGGNGAGNHIDPNSPNYNPGANIFGDVAVTFHAGDVNYFFGGSNEKGNITGTKSIYILNDVATCIEGQEENHIGELYSGNNKAEIEGGQGTTLIMPCLGADYEHCQVDYIFGGSRDADISGDVELTIIGGKYNYVFGGNNLGGTITGNVTLNLYGGTISQAAFGGNKGGLDEHGVFHDGGSITGNITVNVEDQCECPLSVKDVFGAGDLAKYQAPTGTGAREFNPMVNVNHICRDNDNNIMTILGNVYGGGNGSLDSISQRPGMVTGNPKVTIGDQVDTHVAAINGNVYGGGNAAKVVGNTMVLMQNENDTSLVRHDIYGGGNMADVLGSVAVEIRGGNVVQDVYGGGALADVNGSNGEATSGATTTVTLFDGTVRNIYGGGLGEREGVNGGSTNIEAKVYGDVQVTVDGGTVIDVYGCNNLNGAPQTNVQVDINSNVTGNVFGGGNLAAASVSPIVNINNGTVGGSVFGGGNGDPDDETGETAMITGNPVVTIGDVVSDHYTIVTGNVYGGGNAAKVNGDTQVTYNDNHSNSMVANVFGGGNAAGVTGTTTVYMTEGTVSTGLYGGCNAKGTVDDVINVFVNGGTIGSSNADAYGVFGGGYGAETGTGANVTVTIGNVEATTPTIYGDVYGGSAKGNVNDDANETTKVWLKKGTVNGDIYGGGFGDEGANALVNGKVEVVVDGGAVNNVFGCNNENGAPQSTVRVDINNNVIENVYGGGNLASCSVSPTVYINNGTVGGSVFGGGLGSSATVTGNPYVTVGDMTTAHASYQAIVTDDVFGGGDLAAVNGTTTVLVQKCNSSTITNVYGGGNAANVTNAQVYVTGGVIDTIFGGGHGTSSIAANVLGYDTISISGGNIREVFAGCNLQGSVSDTMQINIDKTNAPEDCDLFIGEVYGGGNKAAGKAGYITIGCTGDIVEGSTGHIANPGIIGRKLEGLEGIGTVYGGANAAGISNNIVVDIHSGMINKVFGGNNNSGVISGTIEVNIDSTGACNPNWYVGEVYGGGDHAPYNGTPNVNIIKGTVYRNVFGGGNDITLDTPDNPSLGVGGSNVAMTGGNVLLGVYGGCNLKGTVIGKSLVNITGGTVGKQSQLNVGTVAQVFGGGLGKDTRVKGNVEVNFGVLPAAYPNHPTTPSAYPKLYGDIYGGSAFGNVNTSNSNTTIVNILDGHLYTVPETHPIPGTSLSYTEYHGGNVYGGCLGQKANVNGPTDIFAKVFGKVTVNVGALDDTRTLDPANDTLFGNAIIEGNVYGCNNTNGSPQDDVTVNICRTYRSSTDQFNYESTSSDPATYAIPNVFGGGNEADYMLQGKTLTVHIYNCFNTVRRVFGGGNAASGPNVHTIIDGGRFKEVFGGGNGERGQAYAADVTGNVNLEIHGGYVDEFFVGSNQFGTITGTAIVAVDQNSGCEEIEINEFFCGGKYADFIGNIEASISCSEGMSVSNLYGGCKEANVVKYPPANTPGLSPELQALLTQHPELVGTGGNVHLTVWGGTYDNIYGGSKGTPTEGADIEGNVTLDIYGGTINNAIYGGCNIKGLVAGNITVTVIDSLADGCELDAALCDVYGGGNLAEYVAPTGNGTREFNPIVDIRHAKVRNVFGGGKGDPEDNTQMRGSVIGTPKVTIGDDYDPHRAVVNESVYGGGNAAKIIGSPWVVLKSLSKVMGNVYGGGNMGVVDGDTKVIVNGKVVE